MEVAYVLPTLLPRRIAICGIRRLHYHKAGYFQRLNTSRTSKCSASLPAEQDTSDIMRKTILVTGATDGIGLETARLLVSAGHHVLLHGRDAARLHAAVQVVVSPVPEGGSVETWQADFSRMSEVDKLATDVMKKHLKLDVLINNAGVLKTPHKVTPDDLDVRFAVNTIAPYLLTKRLLPLLGSSGRVVNVSSAAQTPVSLLALSGQLKPDSDMSAYGQSKLALTMWSTAMARKSDAVIVAVNPGSLLGTKMVKEGYGIAGTDLRVGADALVRAALSDDFADASGKFFDNDARRFTQPHPDALAMDRSEQIVRTMERVLEKIFPPASTDHESMQGRASGSQ